MFRLSFYYSLNPWLIGIAVVLLVFGWARAAQLARLTDTLWQKRAFSAANLVLLGIGLFIIAKFTIFGRTPTDTHTFVFAMDTSKSDFWPEIRLNVLLYIPLGISLPFALAAARMKHPFLATALAGLIITLSIESWQYLAGTGTSQGTDIICNTLGAVIGGCSYLLFVWQLKDSPHITQK